MSWLTAVGSWFQGAAQSFVCDTDGGPGCQYRSPEPKKERNYHYSFNIEDKGVDVSGFIVHTAKKNQGRHKFRVHLDSNDNGKFDKNDSFYGHSGLKTKDSKRGVGQILDDNEIGELKIKFKTLESNASMKASEDSEPKLMDTDPIIKVMKFKHGSLDTTASMRTSDSSSVAEVTPNYCTSQSVCSLGEVDCGECQEILLNIFGCTDSQVESAIDGAVGMGCCVVL